MVEQMLLSGAGGSYPAFGSSDTLEMLSKGLDAGSGVDAGAFTGGRALTRESLDATLVNVLWNQDQAKLYQRVKKTNIRSVVHQWDLRTDVGATDGVFVDETDDGTEATQTISRQYTQAKYMQTLRKVSLQAKESDMIEDAIALEKEGGALVIIKIIEQTMFNGRSANLAEQFDGLDAQILASNVIDLRGADATAALFEDQVNEASGLIAENYGQGTTQFSSVPVMRDFQRSLADRIRVPAGPQAYGASPFAKYPTTFGELEQLWDVFIREGGAPVASVLTASAPATPTVGVPSVGAKTGSLFAASDVGTYYYQVVGMNKFGDSVASAAQSAAVAAAGDGVTLAVTNGSPAAVAYKVYRSKKGAADGSDCRYAFTVPVTGSPMNIVDLNTDLPGTSSSYILTLDAVYNAIEWLSFIGLMKFDLFSATAAVFPFLMLSYGALAVKKPQQHVRIKNISPSNLGWY